MFWKLLEGFQGNTFGHFFIKEPGILLKRTLPPVLLILGNYWKWMTFRSSLWTASDSCFWRISISHHRNLFQLLFFIMKYSMLINNFCNSPVRPHSLQNKHAREFLRGSYSHHFLWLTQVESTNWLPPVINCSYCILQDFMYSPVPNNSPTHN